jgi:hypothetical protein
VIVAILACFLAGAVFYLARAVWVAASGESGGGYKARLGSLFRHGVGSSVWVAGGALATIGHLVHSGIMQWTGLAIFGCGGVLAILDLVIFIGSLRTK